MASTAPAANVPVAPAGEEKPCRRRAVLAKDTSKKSAPAGAKKVAAADGNDKASEASNNTNSTANRIEDANNHDESDLIPDESGAGSKKKKVIAREEDVDVPIEPLPDQHVASVGDPTLPHILSIGPKGTAEIFELAKSVFTSSRGINIHSLGMSSKELANLYGARSTDQIKALQMAFGVRTRGATAPIETYLEKRCQFKGFGIVKAALQKRLETIKEAQKLDANTFSQRRLARQVTWITETLRIMSLSTKACPTDAIAGPTITATPTTSVCPCLDDMKFLRYMIYLMLLLQGHANEAVKRQIQQIPLSKILASVEKGNMTDATVAIREAIQLLSALVQADTKGQTSDLHEALVQIHMKLRKGQPVPSDISLQTILTLLDQDLRELESLQQSVVQVADLTDRLAKAAADLDAANEELATKKSKIADLENDLTGLRERLGEASAQTDTTQAALAESKEDFGELESEIESLKRAKATLEQSLADALRDEAAAQSTIADLQADQTRLTSELTAAQTAVTAKQTDLDNVTAQLTDANEQIRTHLARIAELESTVATTRASLEQKEEQLAKCTADREAGEAQHRAAVDELERQRAAAEAARAEIQTRLDTATGEKGQLTSELQSANTRLAALQSELNAKIASGTAKDEEHTRAISTLQADIDRLRGETGTLRGELATEQAGRAQNAATIRGLQSNLGQAQEQIRGLRTSLEGAEATIQQKDASIAALTTAKAETDAAVAETALALQAAQDATRAAQDATRAAQADASREKTALSTQIQQLTQRAERSEQSLATAQQKATTDAQRTNQRLEKLLGILALDPAMLEQAKEYMTSGNPEIEGALQKELCDFFRYFYDMTGIQIRRIHSLKFAPGNPGLDRAIKDDIFSLFPETPATDSAELLREISLLFQEIFTKGYISGIPAEFTAAGSFPALALAIGNYPASLAPGISAPVLQTIISGGGLLQSSGIEPIGNSKFKIRNETVPNEFTGANPKKYTPLMILGIKFVQLVYQTLDTKYNDLATRCGVGDLGEARRRTDTSIQGDAAAEEEAAQRKAEADRLAAEEAARRKAEADRLAAEEAAAAAAVPKSVPRQYSNDELRARAAFTAAKKRGELDKSAILRHIENYIKLYNRPDSSEYQRYYLIALVQEALLTGTMTDSTWNKLKNEYTEIIVDAKEQLVEHAAEEGKPIESIIPAVSGKYWRMKVR